MVTVKIFSVATDRKVTVSPSFLSNFSELFWLALKRSKEFIKTTVDQTQPPCLVLPLLRPSLPYKAMSNPYLPHLITDPTFGYLFPHRLAIAAFGVANDYQLNKHRPRLVEGQHFLKLRGADHVERLFYTLMGLLTLADLVGTPQAQTFKQSLIQHTQAGGALVQAPPATLYQPTPANYALVSAPTAPPFDDSAANGYPLTADPPHPALVMAQALAPQMERAIERAVAARLPAQPVQLTHPTPSTADLLFQQQQLDLQKQETWTDNILKAQRLVQDNPAKASWLHTQDVWAFALVASSVLALVSIGTYFLVSASLKQATPAYQSPNYPTPTQP